MSIIIRKQALIDKLRDDWDIEYLKKTWVEVEGTAISNQKQLNLSTMIRV